MLGLPDKKKISAAFQGFKDRLATIRDQARNVPPPGSDTLKLFDQRVANLERFIQELSESL